MARTKTERPRTLGIFDQTEKQFTTSLITGHQRKWFIPAQRYAPHCNFLATRIQSPRFVAQMTKQLL